MDVDKSVAEKVLRIAVAEAKGGKVNPIWIGKIEKLSQYCESGSAKTHIAFFGTEILAKAVDPTVDLFAVKPTHAEGNPRAWSARTLSEKVLVPLSAELGINIGVNGRQPLNNQPYFRMRYLGDGTPVHAGSSEAFNYMMELIKELSDITNLDELRLILSSYVLVRAKYKPSYSVHANLLKINPDSLSLILENFVSEDSENGKRAQAVAAGLMDIFAGNGRVESGKINDPSRHYPGDVCIRSMNEPETWEKAFEVRDKPVKTSDIFIFCNKCLSMGVKEAAVLMLSNNQQRINQGSISDWAFQNNIGLTLFYGWGPFVEQVLFWSDIAKPEAVDQAIDCIQERIVGIECPPSTLLRFQSLLALSTQRGIIDIPN